MSKPIIVMKIPEDYPRRMSPEELNQWVNVAKNALGDNYILVPTPLDIEALDKTQKIIPIDAKLYSIEELEDMIRRWNK